MRTPAEDQRGEAVYVAGGRPLLGDAAQHQVNPVAPFELGCRGRLLLEVVEELCRRPVERALIHTLGSASLIRGDIAP